MAIHSVSRIIMAMTVALTASAGICAREHGVPGDVPPVAVRDEGYCGVDSICRRLSARALAPVEGVWQFGVPGTTVAICRAAAAGSTAPTYTVTCVHGARYDIAPGTVMGYIFTSARNGSYDAYIYTDVDNRGQLCKPRRYNLSIDNGGGLMFTEVKRGYTLSPGRLFSRLFVVGLRYRDNTPDDHEGCRRIYPSTATSSVIPVYL